MIYVEVDKQDLSRVKRKLNDLSKAPSHLRNAINRTATQAMQMIRAGRSRGYTLKASRFNSDIKVYRASANRLDALIKSQGRPPTIGSFKTSAPKSGGKADVVKTGLKEIAARGGGKAFIGQGGKIKDLMVKRETRDRDSIQVLHGPSVPKMVEMIYKGKRGGQGEMEPRVKKILHEEIGKEIAKIS